MKTLGSKIKEARLKRNISHEKIHKKTKIAISVIQAIEQGHASTLPKPHYRAFVRAIAKVVHLDGDALLREYDSRQRRFEEEGIVPQPKQTSIVVRNFFQTHQKMFVVSVIGLVCLLVIGLYVHYGKSLFVEPEIPAKGTASSSSKQDSSQVTFSFEVTSLGDAKIFIEKDRRGAEEIKMNHGQRISWQVDSLVVLHLQNPKAVRLSLNEKRLMFQSEPDTTPVALSISAHGIFHQSFSRYFSKTQKEELHDTVFLTGRVSPKELFKALPEFEANRMLYQPDTNSVIQIVQYKENIRVMAYFNAMDLVSSEMIPAMFKVMQDDRLSDIPVQFIGVDSHFNDGLGYADKYHIQEVPVILIFYGKKELGRISGYSQGSVEEAISKIVQKSLIFKEKNES